MNGPNSLVKTVQAFAGHAMAGATVFVILALLAFGLGKFVHLLASYGADATLVTLLTGLEYLIFGADALCMIFFLYSAVKAAYEEMRE